MDNIDFSDIHKVNFILDTILQRLSEIGRIDPIPYSRVFAESGFESLSDRDKSSIIKKLLNDGFIHEFVLELGKIKYPSSYSISVDGLIFIFNKGYTEQFINSTRIKKRNDYFDKLSLQKLKHDTSLSKWQRYTFWPVFICGLISFCFTIYNLIKDAKKDKENEMQLKVVQQSLQDNKSELATLRTLTLNQKHLDSLNNSKPQWIHSVSLKKEK